MSSYPSGPDPFLSSLGDAVNAQVDAGIELVTDGQTRDDMIRLFARGLRGFRSRERITVVSRITYKGGITVEDQRYARSLLPKGVLLKGIITGPTTLIKAVDHSYYGDPYEATMDTARALALEVEELSHVCDVIQIDEPHLSVDHVEYACEAIATVTEGADVPISLHVCGDVSDIASELVEYPVDILDHEFAENPDLFDVYGDIDSEKRMAVGVVTTRDELESEDTVFERISRAYDTFGPTCLLDPDCGLRMLDRHTADGKMQLLVDARNRFMEMI